MLSIRYIDLGDHDQCERKPVLRTSTLAADFSAELIHISASAQVEYRSRPDVPSLALHSTIRLDGETSIDGLGRSEVRDLRNKLTFVPAGCSAEGWATYEKRPSWFLALGFDPPDDEKHDFNLAAMPPGLYFENEELRTTILKLKPLLAGFSFAESAYVETVGLSLLVELDRRNRSYGPETGPVKRRLTKRQVKQIADYTNGAISNSVSILELSRLVGLSRLDFIRAFKKTTGLSPYQFILKQRVAHAERLLSDPQLTIDDVAVSACFGSSEKMSRVFFNSTGITPTHFRRALKS